MRLHHMNKLPKATTCELIYLFIYILQVFILTCSSLSPFACLWLVAWTQQINGLASVAVPHALPKIGHYGFYVKSCQGTNLDIF